MILRLYRNVFSRGRFFHYFQKNNSVSNAFSEIRLDIWVGFLSKSRFAHAQCDTKTNVAFMWIKNIYPSDTITDDCMLSSMNVLNAFVAVFFFFFRSFRLFALYQLHSFASIHTCIVNFLHWILYRNHHTRQQRKNKTKWGEVNRIDSNENDMKYSLNFRLSQFRSIFVLFLIFIFSYSWYPSLI